MISVSEWSNPDEIERDVPLVADLHRYWASLNGGSAPERASIDPEAIKSLLPHTMLVAFEFRPFRVRYRLTGTAIDAATGFRVTGRYLDEFAMEPFKDGVMQVHQAYERAAISATPQVGTYPSLSPWPEEHRVPYGIFPLTVAGKIAQAIAIEQVHHLAPFRGGKTWNDCLAAHRAGGPSELELMHLR
jgi:hypothetical protein